MRREIKFRAWDKENKSMRYDAQNVYDEGLGDFFGQLLDWKGEDGDYACEIMQFTGLTDKNGKEIFEGDFCKDTDGRILEVGWSDKFASFVLKNERWAFKHWFGESCEPEEVEVIGNVYENPELLT